MSRKVGRAGTPFWTHRGWGVCCLPGCSSGSGLEFRGLAGEESTQLESRLVEAALPEKGGGDEVGGVRSKVRSGVQGHTDLCPLLPNGPVARGGQPASHTCQPQSHSDPSTMNKKTFFSLFRRGMFGTLHSPILGAVTVSLHVRVRCESAVAP